MSGTTLIQILFVIQINLLNFAWLDQKCGIVNDHCYAILSHTGDVKLASDVCLSTRCSERRCRNSNMALLSILSKTDLDDVLKLSKQHQFDRPVWTVNVLQLQVPRREKCFILPNHTKVLEYWIDETQCYNPPLSQKLLVNGVHVALSVLPTNNSDIQVACWFAVTDSRPHNYTVVCKAKLQDYITSTTRNTESSTSVLTPTHAMKYCPELHYFGITWPRTFAGHTAVVKCPNDLANAEWKCNEVTGTFRKEDLKVLNCSSKTVKPAFKLCDTNVSSLTCLNNLTSEMSKHSNLISTDTDELIASVTMDKVVSHLTFDLSKISNEVLRKEYCYDVTKLVVHFTSHLWKDNHSHKHSESVGTSLASTIMNMIEQLMYINMCTLKNLPFNYSDDNIDAKSFLIRKDMKTVAYISPMDGASVIAIQNMSQVFQDSSIDILSAIGFTYTLNDLVAINNYNLSSRSTSHKEQLLNSLLVGFNINKTSMKFEDKLVKIKFKNINHGGTSPKCVYWVSVAKSWGNTGFWNTDGCEIVHAETTSDYTTCRCNHLTNFAILMDFDSSMKKTDEGYLTIITLIILPISILGLILTVICFILIKSLRTRKNMLTVHVCICLGIAQTLMLLAIELVKYEVACVVTAVLTEYFLLSTFSWMLLEGYYIYKMVIKVFNTQDDSFYGYCSFGYGVPVIIVTASYLSNRTGYGIYQQGCWITAENGFRWTFLAPIFIVIVINTIFFALAIKKSISVKTNLSRKEKIRRRVKGALSLMAILGITWIIGIFNFSNNVSYYIFTLLNASQGIFIFIFHVACNKQTRNEMNMSYQRYVKTLKSQSSFTSRTYVISSSNCDKKEMKE